MMPGVANSVPGLQQAAAGAGAQAGRQACGLRGWQQLKQPEALAAKMLRNEKIRSLFMAQFSWNVGGHRGAGSVVGIQLYNARVNVQASLVDFSPHGEKERRTRRKSATFYVVPTATTRQPVVV
jgi:hypothetical protein